MHLLPKTAVAYITNFNQNTPAPFLYPLANSATKRSAFVAGDGSPSSRYRKSDAQCTAGISQQMRGAVAEHIS